MTNYNSVWLILRALATSAFIVIHDLETYILSCKSNEIVGTTETKQVHSCTRNQKACKQEMVIIQEVDVRPTNSFVGGLCMYVCRRCLSNFVEVATLSLILIMCSCSQVIYNLNVEVIVIVIDFK